MAETSKRFQHSFKKTLLPQENLPKNQFGHTILHGNTDSDGLTSSEQMQFTVDPLRGVQANTSILDSASQVLTNMYNNLSDDDPRRQIILEQIRQMGEDNSSENTFEEELELASEPEINTTGNEFIDKILAIDTEDDGEIENTNNISNWVKEQQRRVVKKPILTRSHEILNKETEEDDIQMEEPTRLKGVLPQSKTLVPKQVTAQKAVTFNPINKQNQTCHNCDSPVPPMAKFCPECGQSLISKFCIECGFEYKGKERFCPECGQTR